MKPGLSMGIAARQLFAELIEVPLSERAKILAERRISTSLRAEVESLLSYDSLSRQFVTRQVSSALQQAVRSNQPPPPASCGPYHLCQLLGAGGMGDVYLAERRDGEIEQKVAIKLLRSDGDRPAWRERFLRERQFLANLNHPSIARLLDAGHTSDGRPYLVMEHVDGVTIDEYAPSLDLRAQLDLFLRVCEGVSHAHRHLIVHRDLKPSNILVDSIGNPKLLDFGIAKLLDASPGETRTVERLLTPQYASPEQLRGAPQTTATDVYSLGAVLYKLLTGHSPREAHLKASPETQSIPTEQSIPTPSRLNPKLPRDLDHILQKTLRDDPSERYASVDAFADDIRAFLQSRPVKARSAAVWYRMSKFARRHRVAAIAATITLASLLLSWTITKRQHRIAQARVLQVRQLAGKVLDLDDAVGCVHSSPRGMQEIVAMSKDYLEALVADAPADKGLELEVVEAYSYLARADGICSAATSGQRAQASESLRKAEIFVGPILKADPKNRKALLIAARISHDRMILEENERRKFEALAQARKALEYLDRLLALGELSGAESEAASELFYDMALTHKNLHIPEDGIRYAHRAIETLQASPHAELRMSLGQSMLADLLRMTGDLEGALEAIRQARTNLENARFPNETERRSSWTRVLGREGKILGSGGISLNRRDEAAVVLQRGFELLEDWARNEPDDTWTRMLFASLGRELGDTLRASDPQRALGILDHSLRRVREVANNVDARRGEVELLASSSYALRRLRRVDEARERIDSAFRLLALTNDYPADRIVPHEATEAAFRALGDHLAETGQPQRAAEVYEELLQKTLASEPDPQNDLRHALIFSQMYSALEVLDRRTHHFERAKEFAAERLELWRHWQQKLPASTFVRRELDSASKAANAPHLPHFTKPESKRYSAGGRRLISKARSS